MVCIITFASFQIVIALLCFFTLRDHPKKDGLLKEKNEHKNEFVSVNSFEEFMHVKGKKNGMPFKDALMIPGVIPWCLNFGCVKSLYYGLSMWLPFFLNKRLSHKSLTGILAASLNVGAIIGSFVCGYLGDYMKYRSPIIALFLTCSLPCLLMMEVGNDSIF